MPIVTPGFNFQGNCEEAIHFYEEAFGIRADYILHYSDAKPEDWKLPLDEKQKRLVYHAEMHIGSQRVSFSDIIDFELRPGNCLFLVLTFDTKEEVKRVYEKMRPGSTTLTPLKSTTYSSCFVTFVDRYGIRWGLMTEQTER